MARQLISSGKALLSDIPVAVAFLFPSDFFLLDPEKAPNNDTYSDIHQRAFFELKMGGANALAALCGNIKV